MPIGTLVMVVGAMAAAAAAAGPSSTAPGGGSGPAPGGGGGGGGGGVLPPPPPPPPGAAPPFPFPGRALVESWRGDTPRQRHDRIMDLARTGRLDPIGWRWVPVRDGLEVAVSHDAVSVGGVRLCCSVYTAQQVADVLGAMLCTAAIVRAAHRAADLVVRGLPEDPNPGGHVDAWLRHQDRIEAALGNRRGALVSSVGKDYTLAPYVVQKPRNCPIYGWSMPGAALSGPPGEQVPMIQSPLTGCGSSHGTDGDDGLWFFDYSHSVRLVAPVARLAGEQVSLARIYQERGELVSHLGNREVIPTRHPSVPVAAAA